MSSKVFESSSRHLSGEPCKAKVLSTVRQGLLERKSFYSGLMYLYLTPLAPRGSYSVNIQVTEGLWINLSIMKKFKKVLYKYFLDVRKTSFQYAIFTIGVSCSPWSKQLGKKAAPELERQATVFVSK